MKWGVERVALPYAIAAMVLEGAQWWCAEEALTPTDCTIAFAVVAAFSVSAVVPRGGRECEREGEVRSA